MFKSFGISVFIIFQIFRRVIWFIVIIGLMVLAYAHMFLLLFKYPDVVNALIANSTAPQTFNTYPMSLVTVYFFVVSNGYFYISQFSCCVTTIYLILIIVMTFNRLAPLTRLMMHTATPRLQF